MVWVKITKIEDSEFNDSKVIYFDFLGTEKFSIVSKNVLNYLHIIQLRVEDKILVVKSFSRVGKEIYLLKKVEKQN